MDFSTEYWWNSEDGRTIRRLVLDGQVLSDTEIKPQYMVDYETAFPEHGGSGEGGS